jgi:energy-coupling factor transporter transmembrane protein EcfT
MHPLVKILCFMLVLLLTSMASATGLFLLLIFFCLIFLGIKNKSFLHAVRRMRWLLLSLMIIYAFGTPGELIPLFPINFSPTYEGLLLGWLQIEKLLIALAALSLLLISSSRGQMLLGLYMLLMPFKFIGLNIERFAARLMLTLDYVEELAVNDHYDFNQLDDIYASVEGLPLQGNVTFQKLPFNLIDKLLLLLLLVLFVFMIYRGFS